MILIDEYKTSGCHSCENQKVILDRLKSEWDIQINYKDIGEPGYRKEFMSLGALSVPTLHIQRDGKQVVLAGFKERDEITKALNNL